MEITDNQEKPHQSAQPSPEIVKQLKFFDDWDFDPFVLANVTNNVPLHYLVPYLFTKYGFVKYFEIDLATLNAFVKRIEEGYCRYGNPYHNNIHATDVTHATNYLLSQTGLMNWISRLECFAAIFSAIIHDFDHPGQSNSFQIKTGSELAILYNDSSVLENHHVSAAFFTLKENGCNILSNLSRDHYRYFRKIVIDLVLSTDLKAHAQILNSGPFSQNANKTQILAIVLHTADIGHPFKLWKAHSYWTSLIKEEFFKQGDLELKMGVPVSPLCNRNKPFDEGTIEFIDFFCEPTLKACFEMLDIVLEPIVDVCQDGRNSAAASMKEKRLGIRKRFLSNLKRNRSNWVSKIAAKQTSETQ